MAKEDTFTMEGEIVDVLPNAMFRVLLETGQTVLCYVAGRMRQYEIKISFGDKVEVAMSQYDLSRGRIVRRK